jgi:hypothetical protein
MSEHTTSRYKRLFEVRLLHHYWLDEGATAFDLIADQAKKDARLLTYDVRPFLVVRPTEATADSLRALRCLFKQTVLGFIIGAQNAVVIPPDTIFTFIVSSSDSRFYDYTSLTLRPQKTYELLNSADGIIYRYKENVPVLSNLTGATRGTGANIVLFLSREIPALSENDQVESLVLSRSALLQLTSDGPSATVQQLDAQATNLPVYVHQADVPAIIPPVGLTGAPARGVRLSADVSDDVFALVSLTAVRADNDAFSFIDAIGAAKAAPPVYQVRFKNRSTVWTYLDKQTGAVNSIEASPLPLTYFGNAGTKQKPSRGIVKAQQSGTKITQLTSEVYI